MAREMYLLKSIIVNLVITLKGVALNPSLHIELVKDVTAFTERGEVTLKMKEKTNEVVHILKDTLMSLIHNQNLDFLQVHGNFMDRLRSTAYNISWRVLEIGTNSTNVLNTIFLENIISW
jgi:hypothetical protein